MNARISGTLERFSLLTYIHVEDVDPVFTAACDEQNPGQRTGAADAERHGSLSGQVKATQAVALASDTLGWEDPGLLG